VFLFFFFPFLNSAINNPFFVELLVVPPLFPPSLSKPFSPLCLKENPLKVETLSGLGGSPFQAKGHPPLSESCRDAFGSVLSKSALPLLTFCPASGGPFLALPLAESGLRRVAVGPPFPPLLYCVLLNPSPAEIPFFLSSSFRGSLMSRPHFFPPPFPHRVVPHHAWVVTSFFFNQI